MNKCILIFIFLAIILIKNRTSASSRITISKNGYEDIFIALPSDIPAEVRPDLINGLKNLLWHSSLTLLNATKGRAFFRSATLLIPRSWGNINTWLRGWTNETLFEKASALDIRDNADIIVSNPSDKRKPYTLHHRGCGQKSLRIYLPLEFTLTGNPKLRSIEFIRLWSEFRYGIFPENGFDGDDKFPITFRVPGEQTERITSCVNTPFRVPQDCENTWNCGTKRIRPSLMDQHYTNGTLYCEGHSGLGQIHIPDSPSKQNLLCNEEGTYLTVLRSPDFKHGRNAAPRQQRIDEITFRYIEESVSAKIFVAIDTSSRMLFKDRYTALKNAFARFVIQDIPDGSEFNLLTFGGEGMNTLVDSNVVLEDRAARIQYLERQSLPEEPTAETILCPECVLDYIIELLKNNSGISPHIILVTSELFLNEVEYKYLIEQLRISQIYLHIFYMGDYSPPWSESQKTLYSLCMETANQFTLIGDDMLRDLYGGFSSALQATSKNVLVSQDYLITLDEETIFHEIHVDATLSNSLTVLISGVHFGTLPLKYDSTILITPDNTIIRPQKQELIPAWIFHIENSQTGIYRLKTWRKRRATSPILVSVTGKSPNHEDLISTNVWVERLEFQLSQPPIQIFAEVRKGNDPVINAMVTAHVYHPNNDGVTTITLLDDGHGSIDITQHDGVYSGIFTNFTSEGFYNVRLTVTGGTDDATAILKGPSSHCCGSKFPSKISSSIEIFQRESGPVTFEVTSVPDFDPYPPAKVTDLRVVRSYDLMFVLQWTAVGNNYDEGVAATYEIKLFRNRNLIHSRFFDSGLEVYNETIVTTEEATYGTALFHVVKFIRPPDSGLYYAGIRAVDESGNYGEPSNVAAIWLESKTSNRQIECGNTPPIALGLNSSSSVLSFLSMLVYVFCLMSCFLL